MIKIKYTIIAIVLVGLGIIGLYLGEVGKGLLLLGGALLLFGKVFGDFNIGRFNIKLICIAVLFSIVGFYCLLIEDPETSTFRGMTIPYANYIFGATALLISGISGLKSMGFIGRADDGDDWD